jgi:transposase
MDRTLLRDDQWERIEHLLPGKASDRGVTAKDNRLFIEAVLWIARTGAPWRDLPAQFGRWHSVYMRFSRWSKHGVWEHLMAVLCDDPDLEELLIDATIVRAHQHAAGAQKKPAHRPSGARAGG